MGYNLERFFLADQMAYQEEHCLLCNVSTRINDETVLLCDGHNCKNECHMYCLDPPLTEVPEGQWLCQVCQSDMKDEGNDVKTDSSFELYLAVCNQELQRANLQSKTDYIKWLHNHQEQSIPLTVYYPGILDGGIVPDAFDCSSAELIGTRLKVLYDAKVEGLDVCVKKEITGRIMSSRYDEALDRWEHLVYFNDRDRLEVHWLSLREHACYVGSEMVWFKSRYWMPKDGQRFPMQVYSHRDYVT